MKINTKFDLYQQVYLKELKVYGTILGLYLPDKYCIKYNVRYFNGTEMKEIYFYENELSCQKPKEVIGLSTNEK